MGASAMSDDTERTVHRSLLHFPDEVIARFAFLGEKGFRCVHSEATLVRFESPRLAVNIYHGQQSYEIGLEIEFPKAVSERYSFSALLRLAHEESGKDYTKFAAHTLEGVATGVRRLANDFQRYIATGALKDGTLLSRLRQQREKLNREYALEVQLQQARRVIETAWPDRDYATVIRTLKPVRDLLSESEVAKLEFAEKHVQS
jgi:hypothetical protein